MQHGKARGHTYREEGAALAELTLTRDGPFMLINTPPTPFPSPTCFLCFRPAPYLLLWQPFAVNVGGHVMLMTFSYTPHPHLSCRFSWM